MNLVLRGGTLALRAFALGICLVFGAPEETSKEESNIRIVIKGRNEYMSSRLGPGGMVALPSNQKPSLDPTNTT